MEKAYYQETRQNHIVSFKTGGQIDDRVSKALEEMLEAAKETGLRAGYLFRTPERSAANLENKTQYYINKGYSREAARKKALETIAAPYTSEHNLGLAIDMTQKGDGSLRTTFEQTAAFAWLQEHCAEYGFILRYPKGQAGHHRCELRALALPLCGKGTRGGDHAPRPDPRRIPAGKGPVNI